MYSAGVLGDEQFTNNMTLPKLDSLRKECVCSLEMMAKDNAEEARAGMFC